MRKALLAVGLLAGYLYLNRPRKQAPAPEPEKEPEPKLPEHYQVAAPFMPKEVMPKRREAPVVQLPRFVPSNAAVGMGQIERTAISRDPRLPFPETVPGTEYRVAMPLFGPWYWGSPHLGPESYYNPLTYPYAAPTGNFLPQWTGAFIQPRNLDPVAYALAEGR